MTIVGTNAADQVRHQKAADEIATQVDPAASGFFRKLLVDAVLRGMKWEDENGYHPDRREFGT